MTPPAAPTARTTSGSAQVAASPDTCTETTRCHRAYPRSYAGDDGYRTQSLRIVEGEGRVDAI